MKIGNVLKSIRIEKGLTQVQVAKKMKVQQAQVSRIESGKMEVEAATMKKICKVYGVPYQIVVWMSLEEKDVQATKKAAFVKLRPAVDNLIAELIQSNSKSKKQKK